MGNHFFAKCCAVVAGVILSFAAAADQESDQMSSPDGQTIAAPTLNALNGTDDHAVRKTPPVVIMADDPAYQQFRQEYQAQKKSKADLSPVVDKAQKVERVIELALPVETPVKKNNRQLFVFQNITEITTQDAQPAIPLMDFRRAQVEVLKQAAAGKKAQ